MEQITAIWEQVVAWVQANPEMATNGVAGAVLGPFFAKILRGGAGVGIIGGLLGGIAGGYGADYAGYADIIGSEGTMMWLQNIAEGAAGGGILGLIAGIFTRRR